MEIEKKKQKHSACDPRLIYYSDFYDLGALINKNWETFKTAFGEKKEIELFLGILENYRNSNSHGRELLTYQKYLAIGLAGEIRNRITKFRSMQDTGESYFPRIDSIHDNYGNSWIAGGTTVRNVRTLREGDKLEFVVSATDPQGGILKFRLLNCEWQQDNHLQLILDNKHIGKSRNFYITIISDREYHAHEGFDDLAGFRYQILPNVSKLSDSIGFSEQLQMSDAEIESSNLITVENEMVLPEQNPSLIKRISKWIKSFG